MGSTYIQGFMDIEDDLDTLLRIQLTANHYPPVHTDFIPSAKQAIEHVNAGQGQVPITMPNGVTKTAWEIVAGLHLENFLSIDEYEGDW